MSDRMNTMFNHADAFIALPGGLGTLEEIFHISSWAQLHIHHKPIFKKILILFFLFFNDFDVLI